MLIIASVFVFIIAVIFRLLDNSAGLLISNGISVSPFYLAPEVVKDEMEKIKDERLKRKLRRTLLFQKLHKIFTVAAIITLIVGIAFEIYEPQLIYLF
ncbi:hypothetical protein EAX61_03280 [Dokdonia sinensis]|uniref:Uncharacterized protein n=1 Tax=Dokdonia sinensis TaxID=2479847 RepID=A0A3M0H1E1_9FLAO|nr:hypothetical protein [Dokdonia sinensis]RMB63426.1 hypothetical protein EAX61_03280 [Dokdonia sinensis]